MSLAAGLSCLTLMPFSWPNRIKNRRLWTALKSVWLESFYSAPAYYDKATAVNMEQGKKVCVCLLGGPEWAVWLEDCMVAKCEIKESMCVHTRWTCNSAIAHRYFNTHSLTHTQKLSHFYHSVAKAILILARSAANDVSKRLSHSVKVENG